MDSVDIIDEDYLEELSTIFASDDSSDQTTNHTENSAELETICNGKKRKHKCHPSKSSSAARSKRYRAKKANEKQQVLEEQKQLKRERGDLLAKLALLQEEVQALRGRAIVDFSLENRLLRAEIAGHKHFIQKVLELNALATSKLVSTEEKAKVEKAGECACAHLVGLYMSSTIDDSWRNPAALQLYPEVKCSYSYQLLPVDCKAESAQRINLRFDFVVPCKASTVAKFQWDTGCDAEVMKSRASVQELSKRFNVEQFVLAAGDSKTRTGCLKIRSASGSDGGASLSRLFVLKEKTVRLGLSSLIPLEEHADKEVQDVQVLASSTADVCKTNKRCMEQPLLQGWIFNDLGEDRCLYSEISSLKLSNDHASDAWGLELSEVIDLNGNLCENAVGAMRVQVGEILQKCRNPRIGD